MSLRLAIAAALIALVAPAAALARPVVRVNQAGYAPGTAKRAIVMSPTRLHGTAFTVVDASGAAVLRGRLGMSRGGWNSRFRFTYVADFSRLEQPGGYELQVAGATSPPFAIATDADLFGPLAQNAVTFFAEQRDGADLVPVPIPRQPSHLLDRNATVYRALRYRKGRLVGRPRATSRHVDVSGGWFDAGDYLKFTETASFNDVALLFTLREYASSVPNAAALWAEARFGTDWLLKMWDPQLRVLYYQVGIGDGNGRHILGDHDIWRLPQQDDSIGARPRDAGYYVSHRPVLAANAPGKPISPNLAGRTAAAFALCAQVFAQRAEHEANGSADWAYAQRCLLAGQQLYASAAKRWHGRLVTGTPHSYYTETEWRDDMELAATELYLATDAVADKSFPHYDPYYYMEPAARWANAYMSAHRPGWDSFNLYDVAVLAHYDLYRLMVATHNTRNLETNASQLLRDLHDQLNLGRKLSDRDPFRLGHPAGNVDTVPHALGYAAEGRLYDQLVHKDTFATLSRDEVDWVLGRNPWGTSFVVGAGSTFPRCLAHQVANLAGSLDGRGQILVGATVDGATDAADVRDLGAPDGYRPCPRSGDPFRAFNRPGLRYRDDVRASATSEPTGDYTALALLAFAQAAAR